MKLKLIKFGSVKSTNDEAFKLIKKNKIKPSILVAKKQTKGRGTMGKKWISKKGNLFVTIFFEINIRKMGFKEFSILNPYIIRNILKKYSKYKIFIKWPNDLLIKKKKLCGILQETINYKERNFLIIGIGINTFVSPKNKSFNSACLLNYSKKNITNKKILIKIKNSYEKLISKIESYNFSYLKKNISKI